MNKIKPALTAEEWANPGEVFDGVFGLDWGCVDVRLGGPAGSRDTEQRHALAALCLHGQPFGFTREEIAYLHSANSLLMSHYGESIGPTIEKIAALLPPDGSEP